jgi:hypothetical protein
MYSPNFPSETAQITVYCSCGVKRWQQHVLKRDKWNKLVVTFIPLPYLRKKEVSYFLN